MGAGRTWTAEEIEYLEEKWGVISLKAIAKKLDRSLEAIKLKGRRLGLGDPSLHFNGITLNQLSVVLNVSYSLLKRWVQLYNFPVKQKVFASELKVQVVRYEDFWKWAENNKQMVDFSRIEPNSIGPEPEWAKEKRNADLIKKRHIKKSNNHAWSAEEDNILRGMLNAYCYTYPEISERLKRSEGAVKRRVADLGLKARPVRLNNHIKYTKEEEQLIEELLHKGYCLEDIASRINKSALGVRGKLERMGYYFKNGVPYKKEQSSCG